MKAEIKKLHSPDIDDLKIYHPKNINSFSFLLQMLVGPKGKEGEESFDITVCTPQWLITNLSEEKVIFGRDFLIVFEYDYQAITNKLTKFVENIEGNDWNELTRQLSKIGRWEFEDYKS
jgi:hypothetical protein